jgi:hypothetical protein
MHRILMIVFTLTLAGCVSHPPVTEKTPPLRPLGAASPVKFAETRYDVRSYRDAANPSLRHEAHAIYRRTRVPVSASNELETAPRTTYPPASVAPLPASDELATELTKQKMITAELLTLQTALAEAERKMKAQYDALVRQSAETMQLREQLEAERQRVRALAPVEPGRAAPLSAATGDTEVRW